MRSKVHSFQALISLFVAVVFAIAATPGSMAMPAPAKAMEQSMSGMEHCPGMTADAANPCDHAKPHQDQGKPCKNMAACLGMLSCFGMGAIDVTSLSVPPVFAEPAVAMVLQSPTGLTLTPDNPPPIV